MTTKQSLQDRIRDTDRTGSLSTNVHHSGGRGAGRLIMAAVVGLILLTGAAGCRKTVTIQAVEPAVKRITGIDRLAVLDLVHESEPAVGRNMANVIVAELNQTGAFQVMERSAVARVLAEREFTAAHATDAAEISQIGRVLGVDGVIVGEILYHDHEDQRAMVGANVRLVDVNSAQVVFSDSITRQHDQFLSKNRKEAALNLLSLELARTFVCQIAPHFVQRDKHLLAAGGEASKPNARGIKFAENGLWDKAEEQFRQALALESNDAAVHNNLGVCHERAGRLSDAAEAYETAIALDPDKDEIQQNLASLRATFRPHTRTAKQVLESQKPITLAAETGHPNS